MTMIVTRLKGARSKKMQSAVDFANTNGCQVVMTGGGHLSFRRDGKQIIASSFTPRSDRPAKHVISVLRRSLNLQAEGSINSYSH